MANKKITDLQLRSSVTGDVNLAGDDGIQTYRVTAAQLLEYIFPEAVRTPAGALMPYAGSTQPAGWLLCAGQLVSRTTYAALFTAIGTTYGAGDGSTTFALPDLRGRIAAGKDDMGGSAASRLTNTTVTPNGTTLGAVGGAQTHTLGESQIPSHTHSFSGTTSNPSTDHTHLQFDNVGGTGGSNLAAAAAAFTAGRSQTTSGVNTWHTHTFSGTTGGTGSSGAHNNVQPTIVMNYIIKI